MGTAVKPDREACIASPHSPDDHVRVVRLHQNGGSGLRSNLTHRIIAGDYYELFVPGVCSIFLHIGLSHMVRFFGHLNVPGAFPPRLSGC